MGKITKLTLSIGILIVLTSVSFATISTTRLYSNDILFTPSLPSYQEGLLFYDNYNGALNFYTDIENVTLQIGEENWERVYNNNSFTIKNGQPTYFTGTDILGRGTVGLASANSFKESFIVGLATHNIAPNTTGFITSFGNVRELNTSGFDVKDLIFLSTELGELTNIQPDLPYITQVIGAVTFSHETLGSIFVWYPSLPINRSTYYNVDIFDTLRIGTAMSEIKIGNSIAGSKSAIVLTNKENVSAGEPTFIFATNQTVNRVLQSGQPNAGSYMRNSQIVSGDLNNSNVTELISCGYFYSSHNATQRASCNTTTDGASLIVEGTIHTIKDLFVDKGITSRESFVHIGDGGNDATISQSSLYIVEDDFQENWTFPVGIQFPLTETFSDGLLSPFIQVTTGGGDNEWTIQSQTGFCYSPPCAEAGGSNKVMETNISTIELTDCNLSFWYGADNMDSSDTDQFNIEVNNNIGSGWINIFNMNAYSGDLNPAQYNITNIPSTMWNQSIISIRMDHTSTLNTEESFIDNVKVSCISGSEVTTNYTFHNTKILGGDGDGEDYIFYNQSEENGHWIISGHVGIGEVLHIKPTEHPPHICSDVYLGSIYNDENIFLPCYCNSTEWVQMNNFATICI